MREIRNLIYLLLSFAITVAVLSSCVQDVIEQKPQQQNNMRLR
jgi:hypothetical protein